MNNDNKQLYAHINNSENQILTDHLNNVAEIAAAFADLFCNSDWAKLSGLWHDLGKSFPDWQKHLLTGKSTYINHSEAGSFIAYNRFCEDALWKRLSPFHKVIPYLILGHHAGLPDYDEGFGNSLKSILEDEDLKRDCVELQKDTELSEIINSSLPTTLPFGSKTLSEKFLNDFHLWIRMLYSCLVDADFLDTESFMAPEESKKRGNYKSLEELKNNFDLYMTEKITSTKKSDLNEIRQDILKSCIKKADLPSGFFTLNVPTGGGKTLSSMAFALNHAIKNKKNRIITAIPYTSIIEQTANVYKYGTDDLSKIEECKNTGKYLFGEENVLEHHSNFDFEKDVNKETLEKLKLASENWDAPIIVTTNVQLFESLFNAHSSHCRKLHNLANSIIILDEVQMLPPEFLKSILSVLKSLVKNFGVTVVFCSATQPAIMGTIGSNDAMFEGIPEKEITHIIENPEKLSERLKRVEINTDFMKEKFNSWEEVADELKEYKQVLCIVQTRKACRELHRYMPKDTIHLSALMCAEERSEIISEIKRKLRENEPIKVISTQLVECGVDIDFPVVFKALSGLDSIAQAAGRCNREGKIKENGTVFVFESPSKIPSGLLKKGVEATRDIFELHNYDIELSPQIYTEYFRKYFSAVNNFDIPNFQSTMIDNAKYGKFQFRTLSESYKLIDNNFQGTIYIRYKSDKTEKDNLDLLESLRKGEFERGLLRKLTRYSVNLPLNEIQKLLKEGRIEKKSSDYGDIYIQNLNDKEIYQNGLGLVADSLQSFETYIF